MEYWSWWLSGLGLALVMVGNWFASGRMMAVSGRVTGLVNRARFGKEPESSGDAMSEAEMIAAIQAMTAEEFGDATPTDPDAPEGVANRASGEQPVAEVTAPASSSPRPGAFAPIHHVLFFGALVLGGLLSAALSGTLGVTSGLRGTMFNELFGGAATAPALFVGGLLVGAGTRMAGGCTSGHGLCGVSRFQPGSLVATAAFFGAGIAISFALGAL